MEGVLLCLDRTSRLVFILSVIFNITDTQGSEILNISRANFRKILSRARAQLHQYMDGNCGVINKKNSCKCRKKVKGFLRGMDPKKYRITFAHSGSPRMKDLVFEKANQFERNIYSKYIRIFRNHPFYKAPDLTKWLRNLINKPEFKQIFQLD